MYFKSFPTTTWDKKEVVDISRRATILNKVKGDPYGFIPYTVQDGDTIEMIAYHYYGDAELSWLILLANDIIDPYEDFFKEKAQLDQYVINKYRDDWYQKVLLTGKVSSGLNTAYDTTTIEGYNRYLGNDNFRYWSEDEIILRWTQSQVAPRSLNPYLNESAAQFFETIKYYYSTDNPNIQISPATQAKYPSGEFVPKYIYDYEVDENEKKRNINLVSDVYVNQLIDEMKTVLND
jgi:phage tail protein X